MTAKEYLNQTYWIDKRINVKIKQAESMRRLAFKATPVLSDMPSGTRNIHSRENAVAKMIDLENEINSEIDRFVNLKREIMTAIKSIGNEEYQLLLEMRYLNYIPWRNIANEFNCSIRSIYRLHEKALEKISQNLKLAVNVT